MKKSAIFIILLLLSVTSFSQQTNPALQLTKQDYLQKSKNQKKAALLMLGGGGAFILTGIIIPKGELTHMGYLGNDYKNDGVKGAFYLCGALAMLGSIPLFIASSKNKKKGMSLSFKNNALPQLYNGSLTKRPIPSLNLKISL